MKREHKEIIRDFELKARPVEMSNFIMQTEIINLLKDIRAELKKLNKTDECDG